MQALWLSSGASRSTVTATILCNGWGARVSQELPGVECLDCFQPTWGLRYVAIASFTGVQVYDVEAFRHSGWDMLGLKLVCQMRMAPTTHSLCPAFSPCGSWLAFCSDIPGLGSHLVVSSADRLPEHLSSMSSVARTPRAHALALEGVHRTEELGLQWLPCSSGVLVQRTVFQAGAGLGPGPPHTLVVFA